jgi:hypothetical protein
MSQVRILPPVALMGVAQLVERSKKCNNGVLLKDVDSNNFLFPLNGIDTKCVLTIIHSC